MPCSEALSCLCLSTIHSSLPIHLPVAHIVITSPPPLHTKAHHNALSDGCSCSSFLPSVCLTPLLQLLLFLFQLSVLCCTSPLSFSYFTICINIIMLSIFSLRRERMPFKLQWLVGQRHHNDKQTNTTAITDITR